MTEEEALREEEVVKEVMVVTETSMALLDVILETDLEAASTVEKKAI